MIIGYISSTLVCSLQEILLKEGHTLKVFWKTKTENPVDLYGFRELYGDRFQICCGQSMQEFCNGVDFVFVDYPKDLPDDYVDMHKYCKHVIGPDEKACLLETVRSYGVEIASKIGLDTPEGGTDYDLSIPEQKQAAIDYVMDSEENVLIKGENTVFPISKYDAIDRLKSMGNETVYLQKQVFGQELAFGAYFNGLYFEDLLVVNKEYKGANNGNRGNLLTGEVGTMLQYSRLSHAPLKVRQAYKALRFILKETKFKGFIDYNCIMSGDKMYFLEFTVRPGYPTEACNAMYFNRFNGGYGNWLAHVSGFNRKRKEYIFKYMQGCNVCVFAHGLGLHPTAFEGIVSEGYCPITDPVQEIAGSYVVPFNSIRLEGNRFKLLSWDRLLLVISFNKQASKAIECSYNQLKKVQVWGHTWREDIGTGWTETLSSLAHFHDLQGEKNEKV